MTTDRDGWTKVDLSTAYYMKLADDGKSVLVEDVEGADKMHNDEETIESIKGIIQMSADNRLAEEVAAAVELIESQLQEQVDDYLHYAHEEMKTELAESLGAAIDEVITESHNDLASMVVTLADCGPADVRAEFYRRAAKNAEQAPRQRPSHYPGDDDQDGNHGIPDSEAGNNRASLKPGQGRNFGTQHFRESIIDDNLALKDELLAREKAKGERFHARLLEYVMKKEGQSRGVLQG
jgi:hypothetical protein